MKVNDTTGGAPVNGGIARRTPRVDHVSLLEHSAGLRAYLQPVQPLDSLSRTESRLEMIQRQVDGVNRYLEKAKRFKDIQFGLQERADGIYALITERQSGRVLKVIPPSGLPFGDVRLDEFTGVLMNITS